MTVAERTFPEIRTGRFGSVKLPHQKGGAKRNSSDDPEIANCLFLRVPSSLGLAPEDLMGYIGPDLSNES